MTMFKKLFLLLLLGHIIGDFYVQTQNIALKKEKDVKWLGIHCVGYAITMCVVCLPIFSVKVIYGVVAIALSHFVVDLCKFLYIGRLQRKDNYTMHVDRKVFFIDQLIHIAFLFGVVYIMIQQNVAIKECQSVRIFFKTTGIYEWKAISWCVALLAIHKPANIVIQKLLTIYKPTVQEEEKSKDKNVGRFIGTVERFIMLLFLAIGQYSAMGLVLTAKSIARYDRISKEKDFAEYYLLGTLISTTIVIIVSFAF